MAEGLQIYGAFDVGVVTRGGGNSDTRDTHTSVSSGMNGHNFIGFKMSEDLGNGLTLSGDAQFGFSLDSSDDTDYNGSILRTITSTLALSGDFGTVVAGKTGGARYAWIRKYDPFGGFGVARAQQNGEAYANNVVAWVTPEILPGLKGLAAYTSQLTNQDTPTTKQNTGALYALALMYDQGPISLVANYENLKTLGRDGNAKVITFGGSYDFGVVKVMGFYDQLVNLFNGYGVGAAAPVSDKATLKVGYSRESLQGQGRNHSDCSKWGVGGTYDLSKRTRFYADYGNYSETGTTGRGCTISTNGDDVSGPVGSDSYYGSAYGKWGFDAGIRHTF
jgi:predicted porin